MRRHAPVVAVALVAAAIRGVGAYTQAFWQDEVASARILSEPTLGRALDRVVHTESTPPLWYVLAWTAHRAGLGIRDVRLISVVAGALLAAATYALARRFGGDAAGAVAGLLVALGGQLVVYGDSLRAYELYALLVVLFALALLGVVEHPSRRRTAALAAVVAAGALTHYYFALSVAAGAAWLWLDPACRRARVRATAAIAAGAAVTLPWAGEALRQYHQGRFWWIGSFRLRNVVGAPLRLFTFAFNESAVGPVLSVCALALLVAGCVTIARRPSGRLVTALALGPLLVAGGAWAAGVRLYALRNLMGIAPFVAVAVAAAVAALPRRALVAGAAATVVGALAVSLAVSEVGRVPPYDAMARALVANGWTPAIPIAVVGDPFRYRAPLEWYLPRRPVLALARPRARCPEVLLVEPHGRVVRMRNVAKLAAGVTLLGEERRLPQCVRRVQVGHAALA